MPSRRNRRSRWRSRRRRRVCGHSPFFPPPPPPPLVNEKSLAVGRDPASLFSFPISKDSAVEITNVVTSLVRHQFVSFIQCSAEVLGGTDGGCVFRSRNLPPACRLLFLSSSLPPARLATRSLLAMKMAAGLLSEFEVTLDRQRATKTCSLLSIVLLAVNFPAAPGARRV